MFTKDELKNFFLEELRVDLGLAACQGMGMSAVLPQGRFITGALVMVLTDLMDPSTEWTTLADCTVVAFSSCKRVWQPAKRPRQETSTPSTRTFSWGRLLSHYAARSRPRGRPGGLWGAGPRG